MQGAYLYSLGRTPYHEALDIQTDLAGALDQGAIPDTVMLLEHQPVITLGSRAVRGEELLLAAIEYTRRSIEVVEVGRGGRSTYHGPGQLVCYPILNLRGFGSDLHRYVHNLENVIIETLAGFGVEGHSVEGDHTSGVWVEDAKIASIGVRCRRWITTHGFSLNVDLDLSVYDLFDACGLGGARFTSIAAEAGGAVTVDEVRPVVVAAFSRVFGVQFDPLPAAV